jgi:hypothetical protein
MDNRHLKLLVIGFIVMSVFLAAGILRSGQNQNPIPSRAQVETVTVKNLTNEVSSQYGDKVATLSKKTQSDSVLWTINISDRLVFSRADKLNLYELPFNAFSPDNKYIYVYLKNSVATSYIVLRVDGTPILKEGSDLEISSLFNKKYPTLKITDVTGWAAPTLLIVNTDKVEGGKGPSFWFDVTAHAFIQLSTRFD